jgi:hypothetical protein
MSIWFLYFVSYSYNKYILRIQSDNIFRKDRYIKRISELRPDKFKFSLGPIYGGIIPTSIYFMFYYFTPNKETILPASMLAATTLSYPFIVNSYFQDLYIKNPDAKNFISLFTSRNNWRGFFLYMISASLLFIPGVNYFINEINQIRLAYIFGHQNGLNLNTYTEAYRHIKQYGNFNRGRLVTYIPLTIYNAYFYNQFKNNKDFVISMMDENLASYKKLFPKKFEPLEDEKVALIKKRGHFFSGIIN